MRPSDHEFETEFGGGLEAWHPDCAGLAWARLCAEAQRARAAEDAAEAKLREAELGAYARRADILALRDRAEKVESERDEAREALKFAADAFVSVWAALGDRLLARSPLDRAYANSVSEKCRNAEKACRAALGENP